MMESKTVTIKKKILKKTKIKKNGVDKKIF